MSGSTRTFAMLVVCLTLTVAVPIRAVAQLNVEGAWTVTEWVVDGETHTAQPGIFIFTSTHYSFFYVNQSEERALPAEPGPGAMTDAEKVAAYDEFTANAGRYTIEGNTVTTRAYLAKSPTYMAGWPDNAQDITAERSGDTLTLTFGNGNSATLVRREGQAPPG